MTLLAALLVKWRLAVRRALRLEHEATDAQVRERRRFIRCVDPVLVPIPNCAAVPWWGEGDRVHVR